MYCSPAHIFLSTRSGALTPVSHVTCRATASEAARAAADVRSRCHDTSGDARRLFTECQQSLLPLGCGDVQTAGWSAGQSSVCVLYLLLWDTTSLHPNPTPWQYAVRGLHISRRSCEAGPNASMHLFIRRCRAFRPDPELPGPQRMTRPGFDAVLSEPGGGW